MFPLLLLPPYFRLYHPRLTSLFRLYHPTGFGGHNAALVFKEYIKK